ncbi:hypothetical protein HYT56_04925 [Candidatus Woesearchaeota archaeon]|nr:hypothetical protein [Candidatus Woesearchaeota archaeon]
MKKQNGKRKTKNILLAILIGSAVISFWRGLWGLMDVYLFPDNYPLSLLTSVSIGLLILIVTHYTTKELM